MKKQQQVSNNKQPNSSNNQANNNNQGVTFPEVCKIIFVSISVFAGAAFTIMTFNSDVDIASVFKTVYKMTGYKGGMKLLEIAYSIGIFLGISLFYVHLSKRKDQSDPTPLELCMSQYEDDLKSFKDKASGKGGQNS